MAVPLLLQPGLPTSPTEILVGGPENQGDFRQGALVQQTINAFEASHRQRAWVDFPLTPHEPSRTRRRRPRHAWGDLDDDARGRLLEEALAAATGVAA